MKLTKTDFLIYRDCAHNAWMKLHRPEVYRASPPSAFDLALLETGNEVDELARGLFPGGVLIERGDVATTRQLITERTPVLYQPVVETEHFSTAGDILVWNKALGGYDLYEVKASSGIKGDRAKAGLYTYDIAFQVELLRNAGVPLGRFHLVHLDSDYLRGADLDIFSLFAIRDMSAEVKALRDQIAAEMETAFEFMNRDQPLSGSCSCITKGRSNHCTTFAVTNPRVPAYSVHDITRIGASKRKLADLVDLDIFAIEGVPDDFPLSESQANQVLVAKRRQPIIDEDAITDFLGRLSFPLAFLDYETNPAAIPRFPGYGPYHHIPFQFSLDVLATPDADLRHHEFLHTDPICPDASLIAALEAAMPATGSVLTWNQSFEKGINTKLGDRNPAARQFLADLNTRIVDLMDPFKQQAYVHPGFEGSTSIKSVLPVLAPDLSYKALDIQEGATATTKWNDIVTGKVDPAEAARLRSALLTYCALDTRAMIEIWRALNGVSRSQSRRGQRGKG